MTNQYDQLNEHLEYLAGRQRKESPLSPEDQDIYTALQLLKHARSEQLRPAFNKSLRQSVMKRLNNRTDDKDIPNSWWATNWWKVLAPVAATAVVVLLTIWSLPSSIDQSNNGKHLVPQASAAAITLEATKGGPDGVAIDTAFVLQAKDGTMSLEYVKTNFAISPAIKFEIRQQDAATYEIIPKEPLVKDTIYTATFQGLVQTTAGTQEKKEYSWAYQVRRDFQVLGTYPRDRATYMPLESGIEVTFSTAGVTANDFRSHFSITPSTAGRFEVHQRTISFVPTKKLAPRTLYTVKVTKGLKPPSATDDLSADLVFQFETTDSTANAVSAMPLRPNNFFEGVRPNEPIVFNDYASMGLAKEYEFTIYRYADLGVFQKAVTQAIDKFVPWAWFNQQPSVYNTANLSKVGVYKTTTKDQLMTLGTGFLAGAYLADSNSNGVHSQIPFLVGDLGAYAMTTSTDSVVWAHDLATGKPLTGATITLPGGQSYQTDQQGMVRFSTPADMVESKSNAAGILATVSAGDRSSLIFLAGKNNPTGNYSYCWYQCASSTYWSYLSTDRTLYQPTDTLHFWGVIKPRESGTKVGMVRMELVHTITEGRYDEEKIKTVDLTISPDGTFIGQLALNEMPVDGGKFLRLKVGDEMLTERWLDIQTYRKPTYQLALRPDRLAVISGTPVIYTATATFFDGTPAPNVKLNLSAGGEYSLTTDANGQATKEVTVNENNGNYANLTLADDAAGSIYTGASVTVYPAMVSIEANGTVTGTQGTVTGMVRNIFPDRADPTADDPLAQVIGDPRPNQIVHGELIAVVNKSIPDGSYYDYLAKKVVTRYRYETKDESRESFDVTTDAQGKFTKDLTIANDIFYRVELSAKDAAGREAKQTAYFSNFGYLNGSGSDYTATDPQQTYGQMSPQYAVGEQATIKIVDNHGQTPSGSKLTYLYLTAQRGLRQATVAADSTYKFTFQEDDVPNISTRVVIFSGNGYRELYGPSYTFRTTTRKLNIVLTPDKTEYRPGDTATVRIAVTDQQDRKVSTRVNIKAVDEGVIALSGGQWYNENDLPLNNLYRYVTDGIFGSFISHQGFGKLSGAEGGGGGGGERSDFPDIALFEEVTTGNDGQAVVSFKVPDSLTSWRVTAQAVTRDLQAGVDYKLLPVRRPLFVTINYDNRMLVQDRQEIQAYAYGTGLKANDQVQFTYNIVGQEKNKVTKPGVAFHPTSFAVSKLPAGNYQIRVGVKAGADSDAVVMPLKVADSNRQIRQTKVAYLERQEQVKLAPSGRTQIVIGDADRMLAYDTLWSLLYNPYSRLDDTVAGKMASEILSTNYEETLNTESYDPYQFYTGKGLALYSSGSEDPEYAALAAADDGLRPLRGQLISWFQWVVNNPNSNTEQVAYALYGLAQLQEPVLSDINLLLQVPGLPDQEKLTLALALAALGAREQARPLANYLLQTYGHEQDQYVWLNMGKTKDEQIVATARLAILAAELDLPQQYGLIRYTNANSPHDTTVHLELALAIKAMLVHATTGQLSVTYALNGKTVSDTLEKPLSLSVDSAEAKSFTIADHVGNVVAVSSYEVPFDPATAPADPNLTVTRRYLVDGQPTTTFKFGDVVKVEFTWSKKAAVVGKEFGVIDYLPTGLRAISSPWSINVATDQRYNHPYAVENNRIKLYAWGKTFYYYAQATVVGMANAEPPTLQSFDAPGNIQYGRINQAVKILP